MFEGSFDNGNGEQVVLNHGERVDYEHQNDASSTKYNTCTTYYSSIQAHHTHNSMIKYYNNSIVNIDNSKTTFGSTYPRKKLRMLIDINIGGGTSIAFIAAHTSSDVVILSNVCFHSDKHNGIISVNDIMHRLTNMMGQCTDKTVGINNDNGNTSTTSTTCNDTRYAELLSEYGERVTTSFDCNYTSFGITIGINTLSWHTNYIHTSFCVNNENATYDTLRVYNKNTCGTLIGYDRTRDTIGIGRVSEKHSTLILLYSTVTLHNSDMIYGMDNTSASMHTDGDIEDSTYGDGEHRMPIHMNGFELALDSFAMTHNISSLDNVNMHEQRKMNEHRDNTCECSDKQLMFECKGIGIGNGMYKCCTANMKDNTMAIRTSSWIMLTIGYMHTTLHQLESSEHKTVCSRLDGRGVTNVGLPRQYLAVRIQSQ